VTAAVAVGASIAGARTVNTAAATRVYMPSASKKLTLPPVTVGTIAPIGVASASVDALPAMIIAGIRALNRSGGLHGHPLALVFCNDRQDPNQSVACARDMVNRKVAAIVGGYTLYDSAVQPILEAAGIPEIGISPITSASSTGKNVYLPTAGASMLTYLALVGYAVHVAHDVPMAGFVNDNSVSKAFASDVETTLKQINGGQGFTTMVPIGPAVADFTPIGAAVARTNPLGVMSFAGSTNGLGGMRATNQVSNTVRHFYFPWSWNLNQIQSSAPDAIGKLINAQGYPPISDPRMAKFLKDLKAEAARGDKNADTQFIDQRTTDGWVGVQALNAVTKGLKTIDASTITDALNKAKNLKVGPFIPPWTPNAPGPAIFPRASNPYFYYVGYKNGQQVLLINHPVSEPDAIAGKF
jgi:ABC-type branched-subunit amino acid transport system substrate-binding protein